MVGVEKVRIEKKKVRYWRTKREMKQKRKKLHNVPHISGCYILYRTNRGSIRCEQYDAPSYNIILSSNLWLEFYIANHTMYNACV